MRKELSSPAHAKLILAVMWAPDISHNDVLKKLSTGWPRPVSSSEVYDFLFTDYYQPEMGSGLKKMFVEIPGKITRETLVDEKLKAWELEGTGARKLNIDPMILSPENLVISTSKNFSHRIYLGRGVFGDLALVRRGGTYEPLPWTYPDYIAQIPYFEKVRV